MRARAEQENGSRLDAVGAEFLREKGHAAGVVRCRGRGRAVAVHEYAAWRNRHGISSRSGEHLYERCNVVRTIAGNEESASAAQQSDRSGEARDNVLADVRRAEALDEIPSGRDARSHDMQECMMKERRKSKRRCEKDQRHTSLDDHDVLSVRNRTAPGKWDEAGFTGVAIFTSRSVGLLTLRNSTVGGDATCVSRNGGDGRAGGAGGNVS